MLRQKVTRLLLSTGMNCQQNANFFSEVISTLSSVKTSHQPSHLRRYEAIEHNAPLSIEVSIYASMINGTRRAIFNFARWIRTNAMVVADTTYSAFLFTAKQLQEECLRRYDFASRTYRCLQAVSEDERQVQKMQNNFATRTYRYLQRQVQEMQHTFAITYRWLQVVDENERQRQIQERQNTGHVRWESKLTRYVLAVIFLYLYRVGLWRAKWWALMVLYFIFEIPDLMEWMYASSG